MGQWYMVSERENKGRGTAQYAESAYQAKKIVAERYGYDVKELVARKVIEKKA
jgi:hypothetical protein